MNIVLSFSLFAYLSQQNRRKEQEQEQEKGEENEEEEEKEEEEKEEEEKEEEEEAGITVLVFSKNFSIFNLESPLSVYFFFYVLNSCPRFAFILHLGEIRLHSPYIGKWTSKVNLLEGLLEKKNDIVLQGLTRGS